MKVLVLNCGSSSLKCQLIDMENNERIMKGHYDRIGGTRSSLRFNVRGEKTLIEHPARDFEEAIEWLASAGMINRLYGLSKIEHPLNAFKKLDSFKLFLFDTGLLKQMAGLDNSVILLKENYQFKGPLTENYVLQQLINSFSVNPHYYSNKHSELDFIVELKGYTIPIEVKGGMDKSSISFKRFINENDPKIAIRYSRRGFKIDGKIINIPLYLVNKTFDLIG